jgi:hypothetical protein
MDTMSDYIRRLLGAKLGTMIPGKRRGSIGEAAIGAEALRKKVVKKKKGGAVKKGSRVR